jgi:ATP-dependent Clp protease protease subunit
MKNAIETQEAVYDDYMQIVDNHIWFYSDIDVNTCLQLNKALFELDKQYAQTAKVIHLHINSYGGSVLASFSTIDTIRALQCDVHTYVDGSVASAATLISCMGKNRIIGKYSYMLVHQVSGESSGKLTEMEDEIRNTRQLMDMIKHIYKKHTKIPVKKLDELLKSDLWIDSATCLEYGMVDTIR